MTIVERVTEVFEDEKRTRPVRVVSWEISGTQLPKEKNIPVRLKFGKQSILMSCSHQDSDVFLAFPVTLWAFIKLKWHRLWRSS